jgi:hypothetical protein
VSRPKTSRVGSEPLTEANQIRVQTLHKEAGSWKTLGELVIEAAKEAGVDHPSVMAAAQTVRHASNGHAISTWSMQYVLAAINRLEAPTTAVSSNGGVPNPSPAADPDWEQRFEDKREEALRLTHELRAARMQGDELHRDIESMKLEIGQMSRDLAEMRGILEEFVLSDEGDVMAAQLRAARLLITEHISTEGA